MTQKIITLHDFHSLRTLFGIGDCYRRKIADLLDVQIWTQGRNIFFQGQDSDVEKALNIFHAMQKHLHSRGTLMEDDVHCMISQIYSGNEPLDNNTLEWNSTYKNSDYSALVENTSELYETLRKVSVSTDTTEKIQAFHSAAASETYDSLHHVTPSAHSSEGEPLPENLTLPEKSSTEIKPLEVFNGRRLRPRTAGQAHYLQMIQKNEIIFCIGPAGSGKTYLAVAAAVAAMKSGDIKRLVLVRPAVEAGESLGFLPGDLRAKIDPYLRPLFDALREMMDPLMVRRLSEDEIIEMSPLAYMRGRTLNDAFILLDEAQNTSISQMKMFLTRLGTNSRMIISGDITQTDLPRNTPSGLADAVNRLRDLPGVAVVEMSGADIVRHHLVQKIVNRYEE